jgi:hypothetical protein
MLLKNLLCHQSTPTTEFNLGIFEMDSVTNSSGIINSTPPTSFYFHTGDEVTPGEIVDNNNTSSDTNDDTSSPCDAALP